MKHHDIIKSNLANDMDIKAEPWSHTLLAAIGMAIALILAIIIILGVTYHA